jgi:hypothetical protein
MEAVAAGVDRSTLARLCESGLLERLERGIYGLPEAAVREQVDLEIVAKRVAQAVFACSRPCGCTTWAPSSRAGSGSACPALSTSPSCSYRRWR